MKQLLLDTNIYGLLFTDADFHKLHYLLESKKEEWKIYGYDIIRKELKDAPSKIIGKVNVRASLLRAYSSFIDNCVGYSTSIEKKYSFYRRSYLLDDCAKCNLNCAVIYKRRKRVKVRSPVQRF